MIFVRDKGRLCNNILQYGHVYAWGRAHGRKTMSMRFAYKYRHFHICHTRYHNFLSYLFAKYAAKWRLLPIASFDDPDADYSKEERLMENRQTIVVEGWYARWYDLFLKYKEEIIALFAFDDDVKKAPDRLLQLQPPCDLRIGLHIRRGDYATWHEGRYFFTDEQYIGCLQRYLDQHPGKKIQLFVCGNDPSLCESAYRDAFPQCQMVFPKGSASQDLYLLSQCDRLIGPPSTFTLVAAMYRDLPLCWIEHPNQPMTDTAFGHFDTLFRNIK